MVHPPQAAPGLEPRRVCSAIGGCPASGVPLAVCRWRHETVSDERPFRRRTKQSSSRESESGVTEGLGSSVRSDDVDGRGLRNADERVWQSLRRQAVESW